jgi:uncharacterized membrane protein YphA (DoxX/SURF4 family)
MGPPTADSPPAGRRTRSWGELAGTFGAVFLGVVFLVATWGKAIHPEAFMEQIRLEGLDGLLPARALALVALALEGGLGVALLLDLRRRWVLVPTVLLVAFFLFLTARGWYLAAHGLREEAAGCGCFGNLLERSPAEAFWQDLVLLVPPLALAFLGRRRGGRTFPPVRTTLAALAALGTLALAWKAPELPLDDLATRLSPGVEVTQLCTGSDGTRVCLDTLVPELARGEHVVVIADLDAAAFTAEVDRLSAYALAARDTGAPALWVLSTAPPEVQRAFFWRRGPAFEVREVPEALVRPLYRRLPRSFRVEGGVVTETWAGLPPLPAVGATETNEGQ